MTHGEFTTAVTVLLQRGVTGISADPDTIGTILNGSYQYAYQYAVMHYPWFYTAEFDFSGTSIDTTALTPKFRKALQIYIPANTISGQARISPHSEFDYIQNTLPGTTSNPNSRVDKGQIVITPSSTGTLIYRWKFEDVTSASTNITDPSTGNALLPIAFEEIVLMHAIWSMYNRHVQTSELTAEQKQKMLDLIVAQFNHLQKLTSSIGRWRQTKPEA